MKQKIQNAIRNFGQDDLFDASIRLFQTLEYDTERQNRLDHPTYQEFSESYLKENDRIPDIGKFGQKALTDQWERVELLFQLSESEMTDQEMLSDTKKVDNTIIEAYLFFAIELKDADYSRTKLSDITRQMNRVFSMPVMVLFRYGEYLTLSVIKRRLHKRDESRDVLEKVTLVKDIRIADPHRAHVEILYNLSLEELRKNHTVTNFAELHDAWEKTLSISVLNKNFYNDVARMFRKFVGGERKTGSEKMTKKRVPELPGNPDDSVRKEFAARLIGRLLFCQFLKKKTSQANIPLISDKILSEKAVTETLSCGYYHSVLEPLFFEVLNRKKHERPPELRDDEWDLIPFLNGGLFEPHRYDFYHLNELNTSVYLNTLKISDEWCKELLGIFEHYHFTIEENTPVEIEIAIDPEMLGRVFENLLAEINPETGQSARRSTGSYYTPRAIVEYMTDESLKQYLLTKTGIDEDKISSLISYQDTETDLTEAEKDKVTDALEHLKMFDPACGSGAFPMGILQKMTLILQRTDPNSEKWLGKLLANIPDPVARGMMQKKLEGEKDLRNYTRKLGIIRNSIHGADIQTIATEISKLRFFLSLVVEEKISDDDPDGNRGILPLPNLEFKFVCADTLIGLPKGDMGIFESQDEIVKLKELHTAYFSTYDEEKAVVRKKFAEVRKRMAERLLEWKAVRDSETLRLVAWNPFSGESCGWFDPEWMFGIRDGFDIVIGNPPYIQIQKFSTPQKTEWEEQQYQTYDRTGDIYCLFYEKGYQFLSAPGLLCFISSNKWMRANYGAKLRKFFSEQTNPLLLIDFGNVPVFDAAVNTNILLLQKAANPKRTRNEKQLLCWIDNDFDLTVPLAEYVRTHGYRMRQPEKAAWVVGAKGTFDIATRIEKQGIPLKDWNIAINYGVKTGCNKAFIIDGKTKDKLIEDPKKCGTPQTCFSRKGHSKVESGI